VIGQDYPAFSFLARENDDGVPVTAIIVQSVLALAFVLTASFEAILVFAGFTLGVSTFFTVLGIFVLRIRQPDLPRPYRTLWYPLPPLIYLAITGWTLGYIIAHRPREGLWGLAIIAGGALLYLLIRRARPTDQKTS
jgi:APA family basic amino acid/polyamine antiporter